MSRLHITGYISAKVSETWIEFKYKSYAANISRYGDLTYITKNDFEITIVCGDISVRFNNVCFAHDKKIEIMTPDHIFIHCPYYVYENGQFDPKRGLCAGTIDVDYRYTVEELEKAIESLIQK